MLLFKNNLQEKAVFFRLGQEKSLQILLTVFFNFTSIRHCLADFVDFIRFVKNHKLDNFLKNKLPRVQILIFKSSLIIVQCQQKSWLIDQQLVWGRWRGGDNR